MLQDIPVSRFEVCSLNATQMESFHSLRIGYKQLDKLRCFRICCMRLYSIIDEIIECDILPPNSSRAFPFSTNKKLHKVQCVAFFLKALSTKPSSLSVSESSSLTQCTSLNKAESSASPRFDNEHPESSYESPSPRTVPIAHLPRKTHHFLPLLLIDLIRAHRHRVQRLVELGFHAKLLTVHRELVPRRRLQSLLTIRLLQRQVCRSLHSLDPTFAGLRRVPSLQLPRVPGGEKRRRVARSTRQRVETLTPMLQSAKRRHLRRGPSLVSLRMRAAT